jgi:cell wall-associated NlpC family hydrolase
MIATPAPASTRLRRLTALVVGVASLVVGFVGLGGAPAGAETLRSTSKVVAVSAAQALDAYDDWQQTRDAGDLRRFEYSRDLTARWAADELLLDPAAMTTAWATAPLRKQVAVLAALSQLGVPYRRNSSEEGVGFDCSGLTTYAWAKAGLTLPRNSSAQINAFENIDAADVQAGDLVFYPGHVSMALGVGEAVVHSRQPGDDVEMTFSSARKRLRYADPLSS